LISRLSKLGSDSLPEDESCSPALTNSSLSRNSATS
jgi:hypothetical protein